MGTRQISRERLERLKEHAKAGSYPTTENKGTRASKSKEDMQIIRHRLSDEKSPEANIRRRKH